MSGSTPVALYRRGNAAGPRLDHIRIGVDVMIFDRSGVEWVVERSGGISTFSSNPPPGNGRIWTLDANTIYPDMLHLNNDQADHWAWEPAVDMPMSEYRAALYDLARYFY